MYFLWRTSRQEPKGIQFIGSVIQEDLGFLFEHQGYDVPELHKMLEELRLRYFGIQDDSIFSCKAKDEFVEKYTQLFSNTLKSK